jgi:signal transduction histidine kinase
VISRAIAGRHSSRKSHAALFLSLIVASFIAAVVLGFTAYGAQMNNDAYDRYMRLRGPESGAAERAVIVAIDDATLHVQGRWPFPRTIQAAALRKICEARPATVGIDLIYSESGEGDNVLAQAMGTCPHLVLPVEPIVTGEIAGGKVKWQRPAPSLAPRTAVYGHVQPDADDDGVHREVHLEKFGGGERFWLLGFECFRQMQPAPAGLLEDDDALVWGSLRIPADRRSHRALLIDFGPPVRHISFEDVVEGKIAPSEFAGKAVFIGEAAGGLADRVITPFSTGGVTLAGVQIHAQVLNMMLRGQFLTRWPESATFAAQFAVVLLVGAALFYLRGLPLATAFVVVAVVVHLSPYLLLLDGHVAPAFSLAGAFWIPLIAGGGFQYWTTWRHFVTADATSRRLRRQMDFVTHEVRSPLTAIEGSGELMARYPMDEKRRKQLSELFVRESQRMARMFTRFYDVERLLTGEIELRRDPVELGGVVEAAVEHVRPFAERKQIDLQVAMESPGSTRGDAELLEFAVYNLMSNAVKYSPERSVITVTAVAANGRASIEVRDQGPGISHEDTAKIFERFYRTDDAETSGKPGYGLGLMFVREIARHHGGEVTVASKAGEGSAFKLIVPNK